jgi:branched-subunit amino acid ABC-type transport system permease component
MNMFRAHKWWWLALLVATLAVSAITSQTVTAVNMLYSVAGHFAFAIGVAAIPWIVYRLVGRPLTTEQMMATITVAWLILAVANLLVMP